MLKLTMIGRCGAYPEAGQATSGFLLQTREGSLLVDAGSGVLERLQRFVAVEALDAVIISHYHHDHVADLGVLQHAALVTMQRGIRTKPLDMYLPTKPEDMSHHWHFEPWCKAHAIAENVLLSILGLEVTFLRTKHPVPCLAMRFVEGDKVICYTADTSWIPELVPFAKGADVLVCESSFYRGQDPTKTGHMTSDDAGRLALEAGVGHLIMTHLPSFGDVGQLAQEASERFPGTVTLSETGYTVDL